MRTTRPVVLKAVVVTVAAVVMLSLVGASSAQLPPTDYAGAVIADDPIAHWRLGEATGTFADSSPSGAHPASRSLIGSSDGSLFLRAQPGGVAGDDGAVHDDAAPSGYNQYPNGASVLSPRTGPSDPDFTFGGVEPFSFEIWARPLPHSAEGVVGGSFSGGMIGDYDMELSGSFDVGVGVYLSWPSRELSFVRAGYASGADRDVLQGPALEASTWSHVVATYDGQTMSLYVNGALTGSIASTRSIATGSSNIRIGAFRFDFGVTEYPGYFYGSLDEAAVYDRALTAEEVATHFQAGTGSGQLQLTLTSDPAEIPLGSYRTVNATFTGGTVAAGTPVDFTVTGANPTTERAFTDAQGRAEFVYGASAEGTDEIRALASVSGTSVEATPLVVSARVPPFPDVVTESRYITALREGRFRLFGTFAGESGGVGPVILSFGQPNAGGTRLVGGRQFLRSYDRIVRMLQVFSNAYHNARLRTGHGRMLIVVGVHNDMPAEWNDNLSLAREAGADFATAVKRFKAWVEGSHTDAQGRTVGYTTQRVVAGIDLEQAYDPPRDAWSRYDVTKAFLDGYNNVEGHAKLLNYGALTIDPNCGGGTPTDKPCAYEGRGWSAERVLELSRPSYSAFICPQVYREFQVDNWIALQRAAKSGRLAPPPMSMYVKCLFNSEPSPPYFTPRQSWTRFWTQLAPDLRGDWTEQHATHTKTVAAS